MFAYGNPIVLEGAGRIKTDSLNEKRIETVLDRFQQWANSHGQGKDMTFAVSEDQYKRSLMAFPVAGLAVQPLTSS